MGNVVKLVMAGGKGLGGRKTLHVGRVAGAAHKQQGLNGVLFADILMGREDNGIGRACIGGIGMATCRGDWPRRLDGGRWGQRPRGASGAGLRHSQRRVQGG